MTRRIVRLAAALGASAALTAPVAHAQASSCTTLLDCVKDFCIPTGDLEDPCHW
jgi:hypothetical protein